MEGIPVHKNECAAFERAPQINWGLQKWGVVSAWCHADFSKGLKFRGHAFGAFAFLFTRKLRSSEPKSTIPSRKHLVAWHPKSYHTSHSAFYATAHTVPLVLDAPHLLHGKSTFFAVEQVLLPTIGRYWSSQSVFSNLLPQTTHHVFTISYRRQPSKPHNIFASQASFPPICVFQH